MPKSKVSYDDLFVGMDTHKNTISLAIVNRYEEVLFQDVFPTTKAGYRKIEHTLKGFENIMRIGIEGCETYGRGVCDYMLERGYDVFEVVSPKREKRRPGANKNDEIDAVRAAIDVISDKKCIHPKKHNSFVSKIPSLLATREQFVETKTKIIVKIKSLLITFDPALREQYEPLTTTKLIKKLISLRPRKENPNYTELICLKSLAEQWVQNTELADTFKKEIEHILKQNTPELLEIKGVGVIHAARLICAFGDDPTRIKSEAAFAQICGVAPLEATTGSDVEHHRLNRGGDRRLNSTLHEIVVCRMRCDKDTIAYIEKRRAEGKSKKDAMRCLKRFVARKMYREIIRAFKAKGMRDQMRLTAA